MRQMSDRDQGLLTSVGFSSFALFTRQSIIYACHFILALPPFSLSSQKSHKPHKPHTRLECDFVEQKKQKKES